MIHWISNLATVVNDYTCFFILASFILCDNAGRDRSRETRQHRCRLLQVVLDLRWGNILLGKSENLASN